MSGIPRILQQQIVRFQNATRRKMVIFPQSRKDTYGGDTIIFKFPSSGVIDLHSLALFFQFNTASTAAAASGTSVQLPEYLQMMFRRVSVTCNGTELGLSALQDYGMGYLIRSRLGDSLLRKTFIQNNFGASVTLTTASPSTALFSNCYIDDWVGLLNGGSLRYLPLDCLPGPLEISITLHSNYVRWFNISHYVPEGSRS